MILRRTLETTRHSRFFFALVLDYFTRTASAFRLFVSLSEAPKTPNGERSLLLEASSSSRHSRPAHLEIQLTPSAGEIAHTEFPRDVPKAHSIADSSNLLLCSTLRSTPYPALNSYRLGSLEPRTPLALPRQPTPPTAMRSSKS